MPAEGLALDSIIEAFWIEKYLTFGQNNHDELVSTDCLFLAEYVLRGPLSDADLFEADLFRADGGGPIAHYDGTDALWCNQLWVNRKVRSFDTIAELDAAYPASDQFHWLISGGPSLGRPSRFESAASTL